MEKKEIMKAIKNMRIKNTHERYLNHEICYDDYYWYIIGRVNEMRWAFDFPSLSQEQEEKICESFLIDHPCWDVVRDEIFKAVTYSL